MPPEDCHSDDQIGPDEVDASLVTYQQAREALSTMRSYIEKNIADPAILRMCDKLDDVTVDYQAMNLQQKKLTDYFGC